MYIYIYTYTYAYTCTCTYTCRPRCPCTRPCTFTCIHGAAIYIYMCVCGSCVWASSWHTVCISMKFCEWPCTPIVIPQLPVGANGPWPGPGRAELHRVATPALPTAGPIKSALVRVAYMVGDCMKERCFFFGSVAVITISFLRCEYLVLHWKDMALFAWRSSSPYEIQAAI